MMLTSFSIVSTSGQLQTKAALDYETDTSYSVTITVSDNSLTDRIDVTINVTDVSENGDPVFSDGTSTTRSVAENTASGQNIGAAVAATDADNDTLQYTLTGTDASSFSIVSTSGQLQTNAALNYESKTSYSVTVSVSDNNGGSDSIAVTIDVTNVNEAPVFTDGTTASRSVAENTAAGQNIGDAVAATDVDGGTTLVYTLGGDDASSFSIVSTSGQLQTKAALDYETDTSYSVTITVSDGTLEDSINVTIDVTDVNEAAPVFTDGTTTSRSVAENTAANTNIGDPVAATDADTGAVLDYTLGGDDAASFSIVSTSGQLQTNAALDYETDTSYSVTITVSDGSLTDNIDVTINVTDVNEAAPVFTDGATATRSVAENTASNTNIGNAFAATDADTEDVLVYTLGGDDAASFSIVSTSGQLQTKAALDYETTTSYSVTITVSDGSLTDNIDVTIDVTNVNEAPIFTEGTTVSRSVAENTAAGQNIGDAVAATDVDADTTLVYTLSGDDATSFSIVSTSGQLQTKAALDYEADTSYSVTITVSDGSLTDNIDVTINVTDVSENGVPVFTDGTSTTRSVAENTASGQNIGAAVAATDADNDTLVYTLSGTDASSFSIVSTSGQLQTNAALNYESKTSYSVTVSVSDNKGGSDNIDVTIDVTNVNEAPVFTDGSTASRSVVENTAAGQNIGDAVAATDVDGGTTLVYTLSGDDASSFSIVSTSGQLQTKAALDYETDTSYSVTITVSDGTLEDSINVTIDVTNVNEAAPVFTDGATATRSVAENTAANTNIGTPVAATDADTGAVLDYTLGGDDAASFSIVSTTGQLQTKAALDYETDTSYSVTITVSDGSLTDNIDVTINVTDVNEAAPVFTDGATATRSVAENTASNTNIGNAFAATDADTEDVLVYTLGGDDAASFSIVSTSGQLQTKAALDYETTTSYSVTITVSDDSLTDNIDVTIKVTNVNEAPHFAESRATLSIAENSVTGTNIGDAFSATDPDSGDTLTYSLQRSDASSFSIDSSTGQLQVKTALDYEKQRSYTNLAVRATDRAGRFAAVIVTVNVTNVNEAPTFTEGSTANRSVAENTAAGQNIGDAVAATDVDSNTTLVYTLSGDDAASFSIVSTSGQLQTKAALDYETDTSYSVTITVSDSSLEDSIDVTINVTDVNEAAPVFTDGTTTSRSVAENTAANTNIGDPVAATDADTGAVLDYTLGGDDAASFSIVSTSGQLQTKAALDYETDTSYSVTITVSDGSLTDNIDVTINVTDVNEAAPVFTDGATATRSVAENTASNTNIGNAFAATDADTEDVLVYTLGGDDAASFSVVSTSGQLQTKAALNYETTTSYSVTITVSDGSLTDDIDVTIDVTNVNEAPVFTDGTTTNRSVAENTAAGQNIGDAVAATDVDSNTTLIYTLAGDDATSFSVVSTSGQLQTKAALDYETTTSYSVTITVSDGSLSDSIDVTINVTDVNETPANNAPVFSGTSTTRSVAENTAAGQNIGDAVAATDADNDTLEYTLSGTDASSFSIVSTSGQLQTKAALDYETKPSYSVTVSVSDNKGGSDSIAVTIDVTNVNEAPSFPQRRATLSIAENSPPGTNIGDAFNATDPDRDDTLTYSLVRGDAASFSIDSSTGQLKVKVALDYEKQHSYTNLAVRATDRAGRFAAVLVTVNVTNVNEAPTFTDGAATNRSIAENTVSGQNIGSPVAATDVDANTTLLYTLSGADASSFSIVSTSGQLQTKAALDYEATTSYSVTITASDGSLTDDIDVTIDVTNVNEAPVFTDGDSTSRSVAENTAAGQNIGDAVAATDVDSNTTLLYTLSGADASSFSIVSTSGQLQTNAALDYETDTSYSVTITASDGSLEDSIDVTINVIETITPVNQRTQQVQDAIVAAIPGLNNAYDVTATHLAAITVLNLSGKSITSLTSGDFDGLTALTTLSLQNNSISDISALEDLTSLTTLRLVGNPISNYGPLRTLKATIEAANNSIDIDIDIDNNPPVFTEGTTASRSVAENTAAGENIGAAVAATDVDSGTTLAYTLGGTDASSFSIVSTSGQLQTKAALNYEEKSSYTVTVDVSDGNNGLDRITVTINVTDIDEPGNDPPTFTEGTSTTRSVAENTAAGQNIGSAVTATDSDTGHYLSYYLFGADEASFDLDRNSGQLQTKASLDYENKTSYLLMIMVIDDNDDVDTIDVTIKVTNVNEAAPVFTDGATISRSVAENTAAGQNIGNAVAATDADTGDILVYTLGGDDAASFDIVSTSGQLQTKAALDYETDTSYSVTITVSDDSLEDSIDVTIDVTNVNEAAPVFTDGTTASRSVAENTAAGQNIGNAVAATDADTSDTLVYTLSGDDAASFSIVRTSGQLQTKAALDYETDSSYEVTVSVSDGNGGNDSIDVTINVTDTDEAGNDPPTFTEGTSTTRSVAENTAANTNIGDAVAATDSDSGDILMYTLGGTNAASFSIVSTSGQLQTKAALDYETDSSYEITVSVSDGNGGSDSIDVTINVTDTDEGGNEPPTFTEGTSTTRSVAENTAPGQNIGSPVAATDVDANTTLQYTLSGADASSFSIVSTSGQLQTKAALDYEKTTSYSVTITVSDGSLTDNIDVTIIVTDVSEFLPVNQRTQQVQDAIVAAISGVNNADDVTKAHLATITSLNLFGRSITSLKSGDFDGLTALTGLTLAHNSISDISALGGLTSLTELALQNNSISDISALDDLTALTTLALQNNSISDISAVEDLTALTTLVLQFNSISDISAVEDLTALTTLVLSFNSISDISALEDLTALTTLALQNNSISDISAVEDLTALTTLSLWSNSISDISAVEDLTALTTLLLSGNPISDYGPLRRLKATIEAANNSIFIDINLNNNLPVFSDGSSTTRSVAENTAAGQNIGDAIAATDADLFTFLTYSLGGTDADSFSIIGTSGQLQTKAALDYENKSSYTVTVTVYDGDSGGDRITVTIRVTDTNDPPTFTEGTSTTRSVAENTAATTNIGDAVAATDPDSSGDILMYTLGGTDAASFSIVSTSGQLQTKAALDYETDSSYEVIVFVSDGNGGNDSIDVTINVTDTDEGGNDPPTFTEGTSTTRSVTENTAASTNIGDAVTATDSDSDDTLMYTLGGTDASSFSIVSTSGQLQTKAALDYETDSSYEVTVSVSDGNGGNDSITVTINVIDVTEYTPVNQRTQQVQDAIVAAISGVSNADDVTAAHVATITSLEMGNQSITSLTSGDFSGLTALQLLFLQNNSISDIPALDDLTSLQWLVLDSNSISDISALDGLTSLTYLSLLNNSISDISALDGLTSLTELYLSGNPITDYGPLRTLKSTIEAANNSISIDINLNNNLPVFSDGASTRRSVTENTAAGQNIGNAIAATDADGHTLTYSLGGTDADSFSIVSTSGQLQTKAALDYETKTSYTVTVTAYDGNSGADIITVTINVVNVPAAAPTAETDPMIPVNTDLLTNFPNPFNPETWIPYQLAKPADVTLTIYNMRGVVVRTIDLGHKAAGLYTNRSRAIHWDGRNSIGEKVATGVYFYTLKAGEFSATRKMLIRK